MQDIDIVYTTDEGFALPTLASIAVLRRQTSGAAPPIHVLGIGLSAAQIDCYHRLLEPFDARLIPCDAEPLRAFSDARFNKTHVPPSCLARFFLGDHIAAPDDRRVLYLDGDTLLCADPRPLLELMPGPEQMLMAEDQSFYYQFEQGPTAQSVRSYFRDIGIDGAKGYGNSGVILSHWGVWRAVAAEALGFLRENLQRCRYHDQSAINAVIGSRRGRLSAAWNFQVPFRDWRVEAITQPRQWHFCGEEKPWKGRLRSSAAQHEIYRHILAPLQADALQRAGWTEAERRALARSIALQRLKKATVLRGRMARRRRLFAQVEAGTLNPG